MLGFDAQGLVNDALTPLPANIRAFPQHLSVEIVGEPAFRHTPQTVPRHC
jgi:hypothetical protein